MKKIITILVCVLVLGAMVSGVFADNTASMTIKASKDSVSPGEKVTFTVSVSKLDSCTSAGIILGFDSSVYEMDSWECLVSSAMMPSYDPATKLLSFANQGAALEGDIFKFTLKVKDSAKKADANVSGTPYLRNSAGTISATIKGTTVSIGCKHSYDNSCDTTCNACGAKREISHSYSSKWSTDGTKHWRVCTVCGAKKDEAKHTPGAAATTQSPQTCTVCSYVLQPAVAHTHEFQDTWEKDVIGHWHECKLCDEIQGFENHVYDSDCDTTCDTCGHIRAAEHMYTEQWESDSDGHWHECVNCGDQLEKEMHTPGPEATTETPQICMVCGYILTPIVGHTHEYTWEFEGEIHWQQCDCGDIVGETKDHIWDEGFVTKEPGENQTGIMTYTCVCGEKRTEEIPAVETPEETEPPATEPNVTEESDGFVTIPGWLLLAACIGVAALCALFLIIGMIIGRKQARRYMD